VLLRDLKENLARRLSEPLPGPQAQKLMAPRPRTGWQPGVSPSDCRPGAALLLLYPKGGLSHMVLTVREDDLPQHAGQVSLPGGAVEGEETIAETALRESEEETGIDPAHVGVVGCLSPLHIPVSGFILHPVIGTTDDRPDLRPQRGEVAQILEVPLDNLADPSRQAIEHRTIANREYVIPFIEIGGFKVWGATAMVLAEFLTLLGSAPDPWKDEA
jgi:8-oxo-dGTP pyrophosphatase MutT (NUDIX family)